MSTKGMGAGRKPVLLPLPQSLPHCRIAGFHLPRLPLPGSRTRGTRLPPLCLAHAPMNPSVCEPVLA
jgi:hypothetical protein